MCRHVRQQTPSGCMDAAIAERAALTTIRHVLLLLVQLEWLAGVLASSSVSYLLLQQPRHVC